MQPRFHNPFSAQGAAPTGDDEAILLLQASLREIAALQVIVEYKGRNQPGAQILEPVLPMIEGHRKTVCKHCAEYFSKHPRQRGEASLNKRTYELLHASREFNDNLRSLARKVGP